jgi:hypothetical protein
MAKRQPVKPVGSDQPKTGRIEKIPRPPLETVFEDIYNGLSYRAMAEKYGMSLTLLFEFLHNPEHSARIKEVRQASADMDSDRAEQVLIESEGTMAEVTRARELAQFYKWRASKKAPKYYGDKLETESTQAEQYQPPQITVNISKEAIDKLNQK